MFEPSPDRSPVPEGKTKSELALKPLELYARHGIASPVRYLGVFHFGDGTMLHAFRDLRDQGLFYRHPDDVADFSLHPTPAEEAEVAPQS